MAFAGPVSSFHQKVTSDFERLTDQQWEELFLWTDPETYPERPDWVATYLLDHNGDVRDDGRALKGVLYTGSGTLPDVETSPYDYLLIFPNPAIREAHLRFVLNKPGDFSVEIYDASGRMVRAETPRLLQPAEHNIPLPVEALDQGLYLVKVGIGNMYEVRELLIR